MSKDKSQKTNAMRILERQKIDFEVISYDSENFVDGLSIAKEIGEDPAAVYKTLVTVGKSGGYHVFVIPVVCELDTKKAAAAAGEKSVEMIHVKDINAVTGYIRGGCTAIGMKKDYPTVLDSSAENLDRIFVSGGRRGTQISLKTSDYIRAAAASLAKIIK